MNRLNRLNRNPRKESMHRLSRMPRLPRLLRLLRTSKLRLKRVRSQLLFFQLAFTRRVFSFFLHLHFQYVHGKPLSVYPSGSKYLGEPEVGQRKGAFPHQMVRPCCLFYPLLLLFSEPLSCIIDYFLFFCIIYTVVHTVSRFY